MRKITYRSEYVCDIVDLPQTCVCLDKLTDVRSHRRLLRSVSVVGCGVGCVPRGGRRRPF